MSSPPHTDAEHELAALRARVAALEDELAEVSARANNAIAAAQDRGYWLDRWHVDLNALMDRRGAGAFRGTLRAVRAVGRGFKQAKRRLRGR